MSTQAILILKIVNKISFVCVCVSVQILKDKESSCAVWIVKQMRYPTKWPTNTAKVF